MSTNKITYKYPKGMHRKARLFVQDALRRLNESGSILKVDLGVIDLLASSYDNFCKADDRLEEDGMVITDRFGELKPHPCVKIREQSFTQTLRAMKELGLTIKSRSQLPEVQGDSEDDAFANFVKAQA